MDVLSSIVMAFDSVEFRGPYVCDFEGDIITSTASSVWMIGGNLARAHVFVISVPLRFNHCARVS